MTVTRGAFAYPGTSTDYHTGSWRLSRPAHVLRPAPCASACPAGENPREIEKYFSLGELQRAWETIVEANPLPAVTGRVCPHPCEEACLRQHVDAPVAIATLERTLGDEAIARGFAYPGPFAATKGQVAVVGSGPAGISAAYHLLRLGFKPVIFEKERQLGGLLRLGIPAWRLPRAMLDAEIRRILDLGIEVRLGEELGRTISLGELREQFSAVVLAIGKELPRPWSVEGAVHWDARDGLSLLRAYHRGALADVPEKVAIVGAGNTAIDTARLLRFLGAKEVHIITELALPSEGKGGDAIPAFPHEVAMAMEEGIIFHPRRGVGRLIFRGGKFWGLELVHMRKLPHHGHFERVPFEGTEGLLPVDMVIPAIGEALDPKGVESLLNPRGEIDADAQTSIPGHEGIFLCGDAHPLLGGWVSSAVGSGARAAQSCAAFISREPFPTLETLAPVQKEDMHTIYFAPQARIGVSQLPAAERGLEKETVLAVTPGEGQEEAKRCMSCGACLWCDNCWTFCPDAAVVKLAPGEIPYAFDLDYCKGCGICAAECPTSLIRMSEEI